MINYGESKIDKIMFGEQMVDKVMYGESLLFSSGPKYWFVGTTANPNQTFTFKVNNSGTYTITSDDNCEFSYKPDFDTSNVTNMYGMFSYCSELQSLDLSNFDTSKVTKMYSMFSGCKSLQSLDLSNFDTSNVTDVSRMFKGCIKLQSLDLSNFDTSKVTGISYMMDMFYDCKSLNYIRCKPTFRDWCWERQDIIELPDAMRNGGSGTWDIID